MDLGFSGVLDKFEEHFGKRLTRWFLIMIALALVAVCISLIWTWLIDPVLKFLDTPLWGQSLASIFWRIGGIIMGVTLGLTWAHDLVRWRYTRKLKRTIADTEKQAEELLAQAHTTVDQAAEGRSRVQMNLDKSRALLEAAAVMTKYALEKDEGMSPEERAKRLEKIREAQEILRATCSDEK